MYVRVQNYFTDAPSKIRNSHFFLFLSFTVATLGIVEFVVFLIQKYYSGLDKAQKEVFADVHFMLFYCK